MAFYRPGLVLVVGAGAAGDCAQVRGTRRGATLDAGGPDSATVSLV